MVRVVLTLTLLFVVGLSKEVQPTPATATEAETVQDVDICDVLESPGRYDKKLLKMIGFGSHGFEDSSFWSPTCTSRKNSIWMEYGGKAATGTTYCCGVAATRTREESPEVDGIRISLKDDEIFRKFDTLLHRPPSSVARATVIGRFFAGDYFERTSSWMGFGHMGCCSLLVIQEVVDVEPENDELDQQADSNENEFLEKFSSYRYRDIPVANDLISRQKNADEGNLTWQFTDHRRVVSEQLSTIASFDKGSLRGLQLARRSSGRVVYKLKRKDKSFLIVAGRPYWLSFYAKDRKNVIWTVQSLVESPYFWEPGEKLPGDPK